MTRRTVDIVFDGPPGPESGRFVEVEDSETGFSVNVGRWIESATRPGWWSLRLDVCEGEPYPVPTQEEMSRLFAETHLFTTEFDEMRVPEFRTMCDNLARRFLERFAGNNPDRESST